MNNTIRPRTVEIIGKLLRPLAHEGLFGQEELTTIITNLKHLSKHGELMPVIQPKLVDQRTAADILGISLASFKQYERNNEFPFPRKKVGSCIRYLNQHVIEYAMTVDENDQTQAE